MAGLLPKNGCSARPARIEWLNIHELGADDPAAAAALAIGAAVGRLAAERSRRQETCR